MQGVGNRSFWTFAHRSITPSVIKMNLRAVVTRRCPFCKHDVNAYVDGQHPANTPHDGDISICANCSGLSVFEGSELRLPTPNELARSMRDQKLLRAIKEVRSALYGWEVF
jgi:hypothetical protein